MKDQVKLETVFIDEPSLKEICRFDHPLVLEWRQLWRDLPEESKDPFTNPVWLLTWLMFHGLNSGRDIGLYIFRRNHELLTVIPFEIRPLGKLPLKFGYYLSNRTERILEGASIALHKDYHDQVIRLLFASKIGKYGKPSYIYFERVDESNYLLKTTQPAFIMPSIRRSIIDSPTDYEIFLNSLGKNFRSSLRKARNKLNNHETIEFAEFTSPEGIPHAFQRYMRIDDSSWKSRSGATLSSNEATQAMIIGSVIELSKEGHAMLQILTVDGVDVGGQMCFLFHNTLHVVKVCFKEGYEKISPGNMLIEWTLKDFCPRYDIEKVSLVTDLPWHQKWRPEKLPTYELFLFRRGIAGTLGKLIHVPVAYRLKLLLRKYGLFEKVKKLKTDWAIDVKKEP